MTESVRHSEPTGCPVEMADGKPCGRPIHPAPSDVDEQPVCLMHSRDQRKDAKAFRDETDAILARASRFHRPTEPFDFSCFVFPEANFGRATFTQRAFFGGATFTQGADFEEATFTEAADFTSTLWGAGKDAPVGETVVEPAIADFRDAKFIKPEQVRFLQVNAKGRQGFRGRFVNCLTKGVLFEDVQWHREKGRMVLQDELDRLANASGAATYEQVAAAYRRFVINFDEAKHYDLSEDCMIGAMEMKRLDPDQPIFVRRAVNLYRWASNYGSSYLWALGVLVFMVGVFGPFYSLSGLTPKPERTVLEPVGLIHSVEVATFKSETHAIAGSGVAWFLEILERVLIPAQVALFLLALRRRFRR